MFVIDQNSILDSNSNNIEEFVNCWGQFYNYVPTDFGTNNIIDYVKELTIGNNLKEQNIIKLLRWKSPRHLTHPNSSGQVNLKVQAVTEKLDEINQFRQGLISCDVFLNTCSSIFESGWVYKVFLFHIARPFDFPIWDQHVARVHAMLTTRDSSGDWDHYLAYKKWFNDLCDARRIPKLQDEKTLREIKRIDSALMAFGQFLNAYA